MDDERIGCQKARERVTIEDALAHFDDDCRGRLCPHYYTCERVTATRKLDNCAGPYNFENEGDMLTCHPVSGSLKKCDECTRQYEAIDNEDVRR